MFSQFRVAIFCFFIILLAIYSTYTVFSVTQLSLSLQPLNYYQCNVQNSTKQETFLGLTLSPDIAIGIANSLCQSPALVSQFGTVKIEWRDYGAIEAKEIVEKKFHLLWNRQRVLLGLMPEVENIYSEISQSPYYSSFWVTRVMLPEFSQDALSKLRIGILDNQKSQTGYLLPMKYLYSSNIEVEELNFSMYKSHYALIEAFINNKVDIISSWDESIQEHIDFPVSYIAIKEEISTGSWFGKNDLIDDSAILSAMVVAIETTSFLRLNEIKPNSEKQ